METMTLESAVNEISQAYAQLEVAKEECKDVVDSALDAYFGEVIPEERRGDQELMKAHKRLMATRKTEIRNIKKLAKAMAKGEKEAAREEAGNMTTLIDTLG